MIGIAIPSGKTSLILFCDCRRGDCRQAPLKDFILYLQIEVTSRLLLDCLVRRRNQTNPSLERCGVDGPVPVDLVNEIMRVTELILSNSHGSRDYPSYDVLPWLLQCEYPSVVYNTLRVLLVLARKTAGQDKLQQPDLLSRLVTLSQAWGGREEGLGLLTCAREDRTDEVNNGNIFCIPLSPLFSLLLCFLVLRCSVFVSHCFLCGVFQLNPAGSAVHVEFSAASVDAGVVVIAFEYPRMESPASVMAGIITTQGSSCTLFLFLIVRIRSCGVHLTWTRLQVPVEYRFHLFQRCVLRLHSSLQDRRQIVRIRILASPSSVRRCFSYLVSCCCVMH